MRISDWSSDVCSSGLATPSGDSVRARQPAGLFGLLPIGRHDSRRKSMMHHEESALEPKLAATILLLRDEPEFQVLMVKRHQQIDFASGEIGRASGREEV